MDPLTWIIGVNKWELMTDGERLQKNRKKLIAYVSKKRKIQFTYK